jgi:hypothetical protein
MSKDINSSISKTIEHKIGLLKNPESPFKDNPTLRYKNNEYLNLEIAVS